MLFFNKQKRRRQQLEGTFSGAWQKILDDNVLLYRTLLEAEQGKLRDAVRVLVAEKYWEGCAGLQLTDEIKVTVAGQAALLLLGFEDYYFDEVQTILVYPGGFLNVEGEPHEQEEELRRQFGMAVHGGPVLLSWWDARWGGKCYDDMNVVLHEFAHKLGEMGNPEAGRPPLDDPALAKRWDAVMTPEFERLVEDADYGRPTLLDPYGAESRCEFFAVATECFFMQSSRLKRRHPDLYQLLADFYSQDPAARPMPTPVAERILEARTEHARHVVAECTALLKMDPASRGALSERIGALCDLGEHDRALADCATLIDLAEMDEEKADAYHERGEVQCEADRLDEAIADFGRAIALVPGHGPALTSRGAARARAGDLKGALEDLREALRIDPKDDAALIERGLVYRDLGKHDRAIRDLTKAIRLCPYSADAYVHRAGVHLEMKQREEARADCEEALRLDPEHLDAVELLVKIEAGS